MFRPCAQVLNWAIVDEAAAGVEALAAALQADLPARLAAAEAALAEVQLERQARRQGTDDKARLCLEGWAWVEAGWIGV